jgi:hypothetical protein
MQVPFKEALCLVEGCNAMQIKTPLWRQICWICPGLGMLRNPFPVSRSKLLMPIGTKVNTEVEGPNLPDEFIKIVPHPHSLNPNPTIIPLTLSSSLSINASGPIFQPQSDPWPWAPFQTLADFEYTETAIQDLLLKALINKQLVGINSRWAVGSRLLIKNYNKMEKTLAKAQKHTVQVCTILNYI